MSTIVITGANRGIGLELCRQLSERGGEIIAACRQRSPELEDLNVEIIDNIDVTDDSSVDKLAERLSNRSIDILINNAGVLSSEELGSLNFDGIKRQFEVNALGPLRVTSALISKLRSGSKVIIITSRMGSIDDNSSGGYYGYRMSKAAVNMAGVSLARDLLQREIAVALLHPGMVATEMTGGAGIPPSESVEGLIARIDGLNLENSGSFWHANGEKIPW